MTASCQPFRPEDLAALAGTLNRYDPTLTSLQAAQRGKPQFSDSHRLQADCALTRARWRTTAGSNRIHPLAFRVGCTHKDTPEVLAMAVKVVQDRAEARNVA
jgi:hypothetical protein